MRECKNCETDLGEISTCSQKFCNFEVCSYCSFGGECEDCARQTSLEKRYPELLQPEAE